jgi:hypothetical protein
MPFLLSQPAVAPSSSRSDPSYFMAACRRRPLHCGTVSRSCGRYTVHRHPGLPLHLKITAEAFLCRVFSASLQQPSPNQSRQGPFIASILLYHLLFHHLRLAQWITVAPSDQCAQTRSFLLSLVFPCLTILIPSSSTASSPSCGALPERMHGLVLSCSSRQVYRCGEGPPHSASWRVG